MIEHWNGQAWKVVPSPNPGGSLALEAVEATSSTDAWAVGSYKNGEQPLTEHWNGQAWKVVPSPSLVGASHKLTFLSGVAVTSATNAWAVGTAGNRNVIERWNGTT